MPTQEDFTNNIYWPDTTVNGMQNYTQRYKYDALGNILKMKSIGGWTQDYEYDESNNYLLGHGDGMIYGYDTHGNIIHMPHLSEMRWDYLDRLHSTTNGTFTSYYHYDSEGNRTRKVVKKGNICEERYYLCGYEVFRKYNNNSISYERKSLNVSDDEKFFIRIETGEYSGHDIERYQYDNHLGSACLELDRNGMIISYEEYHPFGTTSYRSGRDEIEVSLKRYKYNGKERDEESGLYYYGARYYAPWLCRFISVDPLQDKYPNKSPYHYCSNNPVNRVDPNGKDDFDTKGNPIENAPKSDDIYIKIDGERTSISEVDLSKHNDVVKKVINRYAKEVGITSEVDISTYTGPETDPLAFAHGNAIFVIDRGGNIAKALSNKYALMNTLEHESIHVERGHGFEEKKPSNLEHAKVYAEQIKSDNFKKAPVEYQEGIIGTMRNLMEKAVNNEFISERPVLELMETINKNLKGTPYSISNGSHWSNFQLNIHNSNKKK